jgi:nitroimidazol reductase NimA-like FMN-containing flavoprotein (pyridoxamine 5'-phosphate oxidase superfamily)
MRRSVREITRNSAIEAFIQREQIIRVAFYGAREPMLI